MRPPGPASDFRRTYHATKMTTTFLESPGGFWGIYSDSGQCGSRDRVPGRTPNSGPAVRLTAIRCSFLLAKTTISQQSLKNVQLPPSDKDGLRMAKPVSDEGDTERRGSLRLQPPAGDHPYSSVILLINDLASTIWMP
jgi:hypothetical protein